MGFPVPRSDGIRTGESSMTDLVRKAELLRLSNEAALMQELQRSPMGECVVAHLDGQILDTTERMLRGKMDDFLYYKGLIEGLRLARGLPEHLINLYHTRMRG